VENTEAPVAVQVIRFAPESAENVEDSQVTEIIEIDQDAEASSLRVLDDDDSSEESDISCGPNEVLGNDGNCIAPVIRRNVYAYTIPNMAARVAPAPPLPNPEIDYNIIFLKSSNEQQKVEPIVVPPPRQKTIVYVLRRRPEPIVREVIELPKQEPVSPEVFFVNYNDGENPELPGGINLQSVLSQAPEANGQIRVVQTTSGDSVEVGYSAP